MTNETPQRYWRVPLDAREITRIRGAVHILEERCKGCSFCVEFCPCDVLALSDRFNIKGYHPPDIVAPEACTGCHLCELLCPEFAIGIEESEYKEVCDAG
ncbi:MAG: 4Fe-4S dicluster domain-containing protein [Candidatus Krumholzibacteriia bacterium]